MNTRTLTAAFALSLVALSGGAYAQEATSDAWMAVNASKSRADVGRELAQARADGSIRFSRAGYIESIRGTQSREAVRAEVLAARSNGELAAINAEVYVAAPNPVLQVARASR